MPKPKPQPSSIKILERLLADLDLATLIAIQNPASLGDSPLLLTIEDQCSRLLSLRLQQAAEIEATAGDSKATVWDIQADIQAKVWKVRERAGRLQQLLNRATYFYAHCFSAAGTGEPPLSLEYGVHGEWGAIHPAHRLTIDC